MLRTRRVPLFEREVLLRVSPAAVDLLWHNAVEISEGETVDGIYCGSTMMTLDLARASTLLSDACDLTAAETLERALRRDRDVQARARNLAHERAESLAGCSLSGVEAHVRISRQGRHLHIDIDIEGVAMEPS